VDAVAASVASRVGITLVISACVVVIASDGGRRAHAVSANRGIAEVGSSAISCSTSDTVGSQNVSAVSISKVTSVDSARISVVTGLVGQLAAQNLVAGTDLALGGDTNHGGTVDIGVFALIGN